MLCTFFIIAFSVLHPVHLTVTNVEYFSDKKEFVVQIRFFVDDLEKAIALETGQKPDLKKETKQNKAIVLSYVEKHLQLFINSQNLAKEYVVEDYELKDITLWFKIHFKYKKHVSQIKIINTLMLRLYPDQRNLLIFTYNNHQQGIQFNRKHTIEELKHL